MCFGDAFRKSADKIPPVSGRAIVTRKTTKRKRHAALIGLVAAALALAACGRKGNLELPPDASVEGQRETMSAGTAPDKVPERSFVLDGLL
jgi:predicted small lipoprotein YifL